MSWIRSLLILVTQLPLMSLAYTPKEGNVSAIIGPFFSKTNFQEDRATANNFKNGFGVMAVGDFNDKASLEIGIFYMHKHFYRLLTPSLIGEQAELMHVTMGYRRWLTSRISTSLAFYSSYSIGQQGLIYNDFPPGSQIIDTSARDITEYGFDFAVQTELWAEKFWSVILDARYSLSVTNKEHERGDHYGALIGIRYLVQEKIPTPKNKK